MLQQPRDALVLKPAPEGGSGFQLRRRHSLVLFPSPRSLSGGNHAIFHGSIGDAGAAALAKGLEKNAKLQKLR